MTLSDWVSYLSAGISAVSAGVSYLAYRRTGELKTLELRLELRRIDADVRYQLKKLPERLDFAKRSRERVTAVLGSLNSGAMKQWQTEWDADHARLPNLKAMLPAVNQRYEGLKPAELETQLVKRHTLVAEVTALADKYALSIAQDDKNRDFIRAQHTLPTP